MTVSNRLDLHTPITVITSFRISDYEVYARRFIESWVKFWPKNIRLTVYYDGGKLPKDVIKAKNINYVSLDKNTALSSFKKKNAQFAGGDPYNYRMDVVKFSHKVFALCDHVKYMSSKKDMGWLCWIDADVITTKKVDTNLLNLVFPDTSDLVHLGREGIIDYSETGFIGFNLNYNKSHEFLRDWRGLYTSNEILGLREWTDAFSFERLLNLHKNHGITAHNLSPHAASLDAFEYSALAQYFIHFKGGRKAILNAPYQPGPLRYKEIEKFITHYKSTKLLEVGTWNGKRALRLLGAALQNSDSVHYVGLDIFEDGDEELDKEEANVKQRTYLHNVKALLNTYAKDALLEGKKVSFELIKGNSKDTLPQIMSRYSPDFAYIDGGHSIETIRSDYDNLKDVPVVIFDDYYMPSDEGGEILDTAKFGCNLIIDGGGLSKDLHSGVIPSRDGVQGGGITCLAYAINGSLPVPPDFENISVPIKVQPRDCVPDEYIHNNIKSNHLTIDKWVNSRYHWNTESVICVSGGPSIKKDLPLIQELYERGHKVVCVKHAHNFLIENGIIPWGCVILDPRELDGISTHGFRRRDLLSNPNPDTYYFLASMTDPSVTHHLKKENAKIIGWDAYSNAVTTFEGMSDRLMITGGTCAAMRQIALMHTLGFRTFYLFGYDASMDLNEPLDMDTKDDKGRQKYLQVSVGGESFISTGELLAMGQDMEQFFQRDDDSEYHVYGEGGMGHALWQIEKEKKNYDSYKSFFQIKGI
jgi:hypothetical protein